MTSESNITFEGIGTIFQQMLRVLKDMGHDIDLNEIQKALDQAMATVNPRTSRPGTFNGSVAELRPGESVSKIREVDPTITVARLPDEMPAIRTQVRNACAPAVTRARETTGGRYSVEVGDVIMPSGSMYVVAVVKRIE